jgi:hypothetical protein
LTCPKVHPATPHPIPGSRPAKPSIDKYRRRVKKFESFAPKPQPVRQEREAPSRPASSDGRQPVQGHRRSADGKPGPVTPRSSARRFRRGILRLAEPQERSRAVVRHTLQPKTSRRHSPPTGLILGMGSAAIPAQEFPGLMCRVAGVLNRSTQHRLAIVQTGDSRSPYVQSGLRH